MGAAASKGQDSDVRLNEVDWNILSVMADGRRYTQQHLYDDIEELDEYSSDWIRKRITHLHDNAMIEKVGSSSMYVITDLGRAALDLRDDVDDDMSPVEFGKQVRARASEMSESS